MSFIDIDALREEALATDVGRAFAQGHEVVCRGVRFRVPPTPLWPLKFFKLQGEGDLFGALCLLLGDEVAEQLSEAGMVMDDLERIMAGLPKGRPPVDHLPKKSSAPGS